MQTSVAAIPPNRKRRRRIGLFLLLFVMGTFAYLVFASVARFFLGAWGFLLVTGIVIALLIPPYLYVHRRRKARRPASFYRPLPERMPGQRSPNRVEAEVLASFILGASALILYVVGTWARSTSAIGGYSDIGPEVAGLVLTYFGMAVFRAWFWTKWISYDPYDPDASFP